MSLRPSIFGGAWHELSECESLEPYVLEAAWDGQLMKRYTLAQAPRSARAVRRSKMNRQRFSLARFF